VPELFLGYVCSSYLLLKALKWGQQRWNSETEIEQRVNVINAEVRLLSTG